MQEEPLVSCLCVTEDRSEFLPWLLWSFDRQSWRRRELIVVDSSREPPAIEDRPDVRVLRRPPGTPIAAKRNHALAAARGEVISWFDDDDWQHPDKLTLLVGALRGGALFAGSTQGWFVSLEEERCYRYSGRWIVFNGGGFVREPATKVRFPPRPRGSDTLWLKRLYARYPGSVTVLDQPFLFFWLCHRGNVSNPASRKRWTHDLNALRKRLGKVVWGDTDDALEDLRRRLGMASGNGSTASAKPRGPKVSAAKSAPPRAPGSRRPRVSVFLKATVLDAPFLETLVPHMLEQARYPFVERALVVDRRPSLRGKYRRRTSGTWAELDRALARLLESGVIDRVLTVDAGRARKSAILRRYFGADAGRIPTHAVTGGPIYPTLFGLESMPTDLVLQMDADVMFHAGSRSWVEQALERLERDRRLWLMMTHPGPPAGPVGRSLSARNARLAEWDPELEVWRFRSATTRYFLCDRRRLHGRLRLRSARGGCAPLEDLIGDALKRHGGSRGNLGDLDSWHLHAWSHEPPFPGWAADLARAVAAGQYPSLQCGKYDLRLDRERDREAWRAVLEQTEPVPAADPPVRLRAASTDPVPCRGKAEMTVVIPVRDRWGASLRNALASLSWQTAGRPAAVIVVSLGSRPEVDRRLAGLCAETGAVLLAAGCPSEPWNKPLALNLGIRAAPVDVPALMVMDADIILAPNFLAVVLERLREEQRRFLICRCLDLPRDTKLPSDPVELATAYESLRAQASPRPRGSTGAIQASLRSFFFEARGYDEDLSWWGAMDNDMVERAQTAGLAVEWIDGSSLLHQWHPRKEAVLSRRREIEAAKSAWRKNHRLLRERQGTVERNGSGWGEAEIKSVPEHALAGRPRRART